MWSALWKTMHGKGLWGTDGRYYYCFAFVFLFCFEGSCNNPFLVLGCPPDSRSLEGWGCIASFLGPWYPGKEEITQKTLNCLSLEVRIEEGQERTTEKWPLGRAAGSSKPQCWVAEKSHWENADSKATSRTPELEKPVLPRATRIREVTV